MFKRLAFSSVCMVCALSLLCCQVAFAEDVVYVGNLPTLNVGIGSYPSSQFTWCDFWVDYNGGHKVYDSGLTLPTHFFSSNFTPTLGNQLGLTLNRVYFEKEGFASYSPDAFVPGLYTFSLTFVSTDVSISSVTHVRASYQQGAQGYLVPIDVSHRFVSERQSDGHYRGTVVFTLLFPYGLDVYGTGNRLSIQVGFSNTATFDFFALDTSFGFQPYQLVPGSDRYFDLMQYNLINSMMSINNTLLGIYMQQSSTTDNTLSAATNSQLTQTISQGMSGLDTQNSFENQQVQAIQKGTSDIGLNNITIPATVVTSMVWITNLFGLSWDGLGDYQNMFLIPLALGILVLILGRGITAITGFSVHHSRDRPNRR